MKATGIVRRIDDLGRVVIPKEIRRTLRIREGDPLEIYTDPEGEVIFKKYSPGGGNVSPFAAQYAEVLSKTASFAYRDLSTVMCRGGGSSKKEYLERRVTPALEDLMEGRRSFVAAKAGDHLQPVEGIERSAAVAYPIIASGDVTGAVVMMREEAGEAPTEAEIKLIQTAAAFLGRQLEE